MNTIFELQARGRAGDWSAEYLGADSTRSTDRAELERLAGIASRELKIPRDELRVIEIEVEL